jgi:hypothetical protein
LSLKEELAKKEENANNAQNKSRFIARVLSRASVARSKAEYVNREEMQQHFQHNAAVVKSKRC